jgi:hypothetical protein
MDNARIDRRLSNQSYTSLIARSVPTCYRSVETGGAQSCRNAKTNSPYTSFGEKDGVLKTFGQGNGLAFDPKDLTAAIASGEVKNVKIYETEQVMKSSETSRFHDHVKNKLLIWANAHKEVVESRQNSLS